jgi:hypothetical protein
MGALAEEGFAIHEMVKRINAVTRFALQRAGQSKGA